MATQGPWFWETTKYAIRLYTPKNGHCTVMDFTRRGMHDAQPRFSDRGDQPLGGIMINADKLDLDNHPDARLIAAAPDLLSALTNLLRACEAADGDGELDLRIDGEMLDAASAAIAKAVPGK